MTRRRVLLLTAKIVLAVVALVALAALLAEFWTHPKRSTDSFYVRAAGPGVFKVTDVPRDPPPTEAQVEGYVDRLLAEMSLDEKVLQMSGDTWILDLVKLVTVERWKYNDRPVRAGRNRRLLIPPLAFADGPRGVVLHHSTAFPVAMARGASFDRKLEARIADAIGQELRAQGANLFGGVCVNVLRHPGWGRAQETYGEDPYLLGEMAAAMIEGVQAHNVMACVKHFALNSIEESRQYVDVRVDERTLREVYLPQFERAVGAGAAAVMSSYNRVNGDYTAENRHLLRDVLKGDWGFSGFVVSDFFTGVHDGVKAANAGLDLEMPVTQVYGRKLVDAVLAGEVPRERIDDSVRRILRRKLFYATRPDPQAYPESLVRAQAHVTLAREAAEKSMVLLKNEGEALPFDRSRVRTLAVMGRLADGHENLGDHGSSRVYPPDVVTPLEGLRGYLGPGVRVVHEGGGDMARVRQLAREADAVVVVAGLDHRDEGEHIPQKPRGEQGGDRRRLGLRAEEIAVIQAAAALNQRTAVVLVGGSAITMEEWRNEAPAILLAFYPGQEGGHALARLLFGEANPSGKLPFTIPADAARLPPFDPVADRVEYGYYHGYTLAEKKGVEPAFPFGFGLSYTRFAYANLRLDRTEVAADGRLTVSIDVKNAGPRAGEEVVQLYAGFPASAVDRPLKLLRGFEKVALAAGETKTVQLSLEARSLAYWDTPSGAFRVEPGPHEVWVGPSSRRSDLLKASFLVILETPPA
jgi:beta-glucosidase